jgi:uncharacterized protein YegJ (DUF2314 family)
VDDFKPEDPANVRFLHAHHAPTPDRTLGARPAKDFVGRYIKSPFEGTDPHGVLRTEHMWVLVTRVVNETTLHGSVENDPVFEGVPGYGTPVDVCLDAISQVMPEFK